MILKEDDIYEELEKLKREKALLENILQNREKELANMFDENFHLSSREKVLEWFLGDFLGNLINPLSILETLETTFKEYHSTDDNIEKQTLYKEIVDCFNILFQVPQNFTKAKERFIFLQKHNISDKKEEINYKLLVYNTIEEIKKDFEKYNQSNLEIILKQPEDEIILYADKKSIKFLPYELINNAMKFDPQGPIYVNIEKQKKNVITSIIDNGKGIGNLDIENLIFNSYSIENGSFNVNPFGYEARGIGIGLLKCLKIVNFYNGKLYCDNRKDNQGSIFTYTLPIN